MTHGAAVLHVEPLPQADGVVNVPASGHLGTRHVLITNTADIVVFLQIVPCRVFEAVNFSHGRSSLAECTPTILCLAPDVEIGVDKHHDSSDSATTLKHQDPTTIEEEEDSKAELNGVPKSTNIVDAVIKRLPKTVLTMSVPHEEAINGDSDEDLDDNLDTKGGDSKKPSAQDKVVQSR